MSFRQPPEWAPHDFVWIGFPSHEIEWPGVLDRAREEVAAFAEAVHAGGKGEDVRLVAADSASAEMARQLAPFATTVEAVFGDVWLRDTGPIVLKQGGARRAARFRFNGWGGKYVMAGDEGIGERLAASAGLGDDVHDWVLEGGAIDVDGTGLAVTTEQCLLNPNRNPGLTRADIERRLAEELGIQRLLWLGQGLLNDHTDGHVDNLARFVSEGVLAIPAPAAGDPNETVYNDARRRAEASEVEVVALPSPGEVERDGAVVPASYMNFYIGNAVVAVPVYGAPNDQAALDAIAALFPGREICGIRADHLLTGGGSFHCISQQVPR
jgi:agmatine deiminase